MTNGEAVEEVCESAGSNKKLVDGDRQLRSDSSADIHQ